MENLFEFIRKLIAGSPLPVEFPGDRECILNRWLVKGEPAGELWDKGLEPCLKLEGEVVPLHEMPFTPQEILEKNWRGFISQELLAFYRYNAPQTYFQDDRNKYIYCVCSVYCSEEKDILLHFHTLIPTPARIWINGTLVFSGSFEYVTEKALIMYRFKKGGNIILVERLLPARDNMPPLRMNVFTIELKPVDFLSDKKINQGFFNEKLLEDIKNSYQIIPDRAICDPGQEIGFIVLPRYFEKTGAERIQINVFNSRNEEIASFKASTQEKVYLGMYESVKGALLIKVTGIGNNKSASAYVFRGNLIKERDRLLKAAEERADFCRDISKTIRGLTEIPDGSTGFISGYAEFVHDALYQHILEKYFEFEAYLNSPPGTDRKKLLEVFKSNVTVFKDIGIEDAVIPYTVFLPEGYSTEKTYPLVIYMMYGYGAATYPDPPGFVSSGDFRDAIVVTVCGRGELNRDYIYEVNLVKIINEIAEGFNVNREQLYIIGICTGALRCINLALRYPDLFAAVGAFGGTARLDDRNPEYRLLENIENTMVYQLCNVDDYTFNSARILDISKYFRKHKKWVFHSLSHNEFQDMLNSEKLLKKIIGERRDAYPRHIRYTTGEPIYNKSHWVKIEFIDDLTRSAEIEAQIRDGSFIDVKAANTGRFSILIDKEKMELGSDIEICVNGICHKLKVEDYAKVFVSIDNGRSQCETVRLSINEFGEEYFKVSSNEGLMGIKGLYFNKCILVKPDCFKGSDKDLPKRLISVLRSPLKERNRNYRYDSVFESEIRECALGQSNFIYVVDCGKKNAGMLKVWENLGLEFDSGSIKYKGNSYNGDYFAFIKCDNPYNSSKLAAFVIYNSESAGEELVNFLNTFDTNSLFYSEAVIFSGGCYHSLR